MTEKIFGRKAEQFTLNSAMVGDEAAFLALYGRRRCGKTFLVREFFGAQANCQLISVTGKKKGKTKDQLELFFTALARSFPTLIGGPKPTSWKEGFQLFSNCLFQSEPNKKVVLFLDELPWLASRKSDLLTWLDHYWNTEWSQHRNFILIACGSAASWMLDRLVHDKGGLHNRITHRINLQPFSFREVKNYLDGKGQRFNLTQLLEIYASLGGVPFYLNTITSKLSASQNIQRQCFDTNGLLFDEYKKLLESLFTEHEAYDKILAFLAKNRLGVNRSVIIKKLKLPRNGRTYQRFEELLAAGFISTLSAEIDPKIRLVDEFTLFYQNWLKGLHFGATKTIAANYWSKKRGGPEWHNWFGYVFENLWYKNLDSLASCLELDHIDYQATISWSARGNNTKWGAQIDVVFDRRDDSVTLCEIKSSPDPFLVTKEFALGLMQKQAVYVEESKTKKQIHWALLVAGSIKPSPWIEELGIRIVGVRDLL